VFTWYGGIEKTRKTKPGKVEHRRQELRSKELEENTQERDGARKNVHRSIQSDLKR
jgi:hypothetical protein